VLPVRDEERSPSGATRTSAPVETDRRTFSVSWNHRVCPLGNGLEFRVMEWLAREAEVVDFWRKLVLGQ